MMLQTQDPREPLQCCDDGFDALQNPTPTAARVDVGT